MSTREELNEYTKDELSDNYPEVEFGSKDTKDEMIDKILEVEGSDEEIEEVSDYWLKGYDVRWLLEQGDEHPDSYIVQEWEEDNGELT